MSLAICRRHRREDATQSCRQYCQTAKGSIAAPRPIWIRTGRVWRTTLYQSSCLESLRGESGLITCSPQAPSHCLYYLPAMVMGGPQGPPTKVFFVLLSFFGLFFFLPHSRWRKGKQRQKEMLKVFKVEQWGDNSA